MRTTFCVLFFGSLLTACSSQPIKLERNHSVSQSASASTATSTATSTPAVPLQSPAAWVAAAIAGDGPGWRAPSATPAPIVVQNLPKSVRGNPTVYNVEGQKYAVMDSAAGFSETGLASWYGRKFHGRETSSGEVYDMYQMTAAHKHLPLPTFVRVTRSDTGASIIVKVNDRGPFVPGRVIDLSYQAASALGVLKDGTVPVHVQALSTHLPAEQAVPAEPAIPVAQNIAVAKNQPKAPQNQSFDPDNLSPRYLQLGAFRDAANATSMLEQAKSAVSIPMRIDHDKARALFRVWVGPIDSQVQQNNAVAALRASGVTDFTLVDLAH